MVPTPPIGYEEGGGTIGAEEGGGTITYEEGGGGGGVLKQVLTVGAILLHAAISTGTVESGSPLSKINGVPVIRHGDPATCSIHGETTVIATTLLAKDLGLAIAREEDTTACGAILTAAVIPDVWSSE